MTVIAMAHGVEASRALIGRCVANGTSVKPTLVLDYRGVADRILDNQVAERILDAGCCWVDLCDLVRPVRLLEYSPQRGSAPLLDQLLIRFARLLRLPFFEEDLRHAVGFASRLLGDSPTNTSSLAEFRAALVDEEVCRWTWPHNAPTDDTRPERARVRGILDAALRYAHLAAGATAATPFPRPQEPVPCTLWVELPRGHVEATAWGLMTQAMHGWAEAALAAHATQSARALLLLHPPDPGPQVQLAPGIQPQDEALIALSTHPSGRPPSILKHLLAMGNTVRLEWQGGFPNSAREAWVELSRDIGALFERMQTGRGGALVFQGERVQETQPVFMITDSRLKPQVKPALAMMRDSGRNSRSATPYLHLATTVCNNTLDGERDRDPFDRMVAPETLMLAWTAVVATDTGSAGGVDGVSVRAFGSRLDGELQALREELLEGRYQPAPPRWFTIPKADGGTRRIGLSSVRDRVVQRALLFVSEPYFEPHFSDRSYAFRPGRSAHHAVLAVLGCWRRGARFLARTDVESCFDSIPHEVLLARYARRVPSPRMMLVLTRMLRFGTCLRAYPDVLGIGVVQGWVMAPFLSNVVLDELDGELEARRIEFYRYADDVAIAGNCEAEVQEAVRLIGEILETKLRMRLKTSKTRIDALDSGADFLGFRVGGTSTLAIAPDRFLAAREELRESTSSIASAKGPSGRARLIGRIGEQLQGLAAYYARLGVGRALQAQFAGFHEAIETARAALPEDARKDESWLRLPEAGEWESRFGRLLESETGIRGADTTAPYGGIGPHDATSWHPVPNGAVDASVPEPTRKPSGINQAAVKPEDQDNGLAPAPFAELDGTTLLVMRGGLSLVASDDQIRLRRGGQDAFSVATSAVDTVLVQSYGVRFSSHAMWSLAGRGIRLIVANPGSDEIALMHGTVEGKTDIRVQQARRQGDPDVRTAGVDMLRAKIANQASLLKYLGRAPARRDSSLGLQLRQAADQVRAIEAQLTLAAKSPSPNAARDAARWMGYEGLAAARYWQAIGRLIPPELNFPGRRTRGATDPVNMALNYAYGLLYSDVWRAVVRAGLDPGLGLNHRSLEAPGALVYDLIEELRAPLADRLVFALLGRGWRPELKDHDIAVLTPRHRHMIARSWRSQRDQAIRRGRADVPIRDLAWLQARALRDLFTRQSSGYRAFRFRW